MRFSLRTVVLFLVSVAAAAPTSSPSKKELVVREDRRGSYTVSGLGYRKQAILKAGGNTLDIAIAMLETENMQTNYAYGKRIVSFPLCLLSCHANCNISQEITRLTMLPTSVCSSRTGVCSGFVHLALGSRASHSLTGTMELS